MKLHDIQERVDNQVIHFGGYWRFESLVLRLPAEVGELSDAINIKYGDKKAKSPDEEEKVPSELADVLYTFVALANYHKINLEKEMTKLLNTNVNDMDIEKIQALIIKKAGNICFEPLRMVYPLISSIDEIDKIVEKYIILYKTGKAEKIKVIRRPIINVIYNVLIAAHNLDINISNEFVKKVSADEEKKKIYVKN